MAQGAQMAQANAKERLRGRDDPDFVDVELARKGDLEAFGRLYDEHVARINSLAEWMLSGVEVDDALQDIFLRAWQKIETYRGEASFQTWLRRLAVNVLLRRRATRRDWDYRYQSDEEQVASYASRQDLQLYTDIEIALRSLSERCRDVFVLHDVEGYKHDEIATLLGISAGTSRWQLHDARMTLRKHLQ
jgi:RNA polymerase sigma-70 factor (ECF subfamily)